MNDRQGMKVELGDTVELWPDHVGRVVCSIDDGLFSADYPKAEWGHLEKGVVIALEDGSIFHYPEPDEDFVILARRDRAHETAAQ